MVTRFMSLLAVLLATSAAVDQAAAAAPQWIVVTAPAFRAEIEPLCAHRKAEGFDVVVVQTTDALTAEQLRAGDTAALQQHIQKLTRKGPSYVLLVGAVKPDK